jgi:hypothetical protein
MVEEMVGEMVYVTATLKAGLLVKWSVKYLVGWKDGQLVGYSVSKMAWKSVA